MQIQADLSAMLDGELDAASVRRVMVHSDACAACRGFLDGIRTQAQAHRTLAELDRAEPGSPAAALRRQLMRNRQQLARILYELGRGFALMGLSADFSREVAREPVPVPDMLMRGRSVLDEVERLVRTHGEVVQGEWVAARELFARQRPVCSREPRQWRAVVAGVPAAGARAARVPRVPGTHPSRARRRR